MNTAAQRDPLGPLLQEVCQNGADIKCLFFMVISGHGSPDTHHYSAFSFFVALFWCRGLTGAQNAGARLPVRQFFSAKSRYTARL